MSVLPQDDVAEPALYEPARACLTRDRECVDLPLLSGGRGVPEASLASGPPVCRGFARPLRTAE